MGHLCSCPYQEHYLLLNFVRYLFLPSVVCFFYGKHSCLVAWPPSWDDTWWVNVKLRFRLISLITPCITFELLSYFRHNTISLQRFSGMKCSHSFFHLISLFLIYLFADHRSKISFHIFWTYRLCECVRVCHWCVSFEVEIFLNLAIQLRLSVFSKS